MITPTAAYTYPSDIANGTKIILVAPPSVWAHWSHSQQSTVIAVCMLALLVLVGIVGGVVWLQWKRRRLLGVYGFGCGWRGKEKWKKKGKGKGDGGEGAGADATRGGREEEVEGRSGGEANVGWLSGAQGYQNSRGARSDATKSPVFSNGVVKGKQRDLFSKEKVLAKETEVYEMQGGLGTPRDRRGKVQSDEVVGEDEVFSRGWMTVVGPGASTSELGRGLRSKEGMRIDERR